jgi:hypothetical protein
MKRNCPTLLGAVVRDYFTDHPKSSSRCVASCCTCLKRFRTVTAFIFSP